MEPQGRPAVFLDRDGIVNKMHFYAEFSLVDFPANPDQFELLPDYIGSPLRKASKVICSLEAGDRESANQFLLNCATSE